MLVVLCVSRRQELVIRSGPKPAEMEGMNFPSGLYFAKDCQHVQICFLLLQYKKGV